METKAKRKFIYGGMATALAVVFVAGLSMNQLQDTASRFEQPAASATLKKVSFMVDGGLSAPSEITSAPGVTDSSPAYMAVVEEQKADVKTKEAPLTEGSEIVPAPQQTGANNFSNIATNIQESRSSNPVASIAAMLLGDSDSSGTSAPINAVEFDSMEKMVMPAKRIAGMEQESTATPADMNIIVDSPTPYYQDQGRDKFEQVKVNPFKQVAAEPVSTFSSDVDTASYSFVRRQLNNGILPSPDSVRVEEMVNYFDYHYALPESREQPFKPTVTVIDSPWAEGKKLMHVGIKGYNIQGEKPHTNLVFLLDVSGSMNEPSKLPLVKASMKLLLDNLKPDDTIAITVYAGAAGTVLEPTKVSDRSKILQAIDNLNAGGSTAGEAGIKLAYQLAEQNFDKEGVNRIILATDGDFNVGTSSTDELKALVEQKRKSGVFLSVLGFGQGNYNDAIMQTLAQNGNGVAAYIDTLNEARKVLVDEASSSLFPIAKDVKFQVEFNPNAVAEYRLVGYETRALNREDFNNDKIDAGDMGAGHTVTAIYEFVPVGSSALSVDPLRYAEKEAAKVAAEPVADNGEYAFLKIRYKLPNEDTSKLITTPVTKANPEISQDVRFSVAVAAFAQILKNDSSIQSMSLDDVIALAQSGKGEDPFGIRAEFINLVRLAKASGR